MGYKRGGHPGKFVVRFLRDLPSCSESTTLCCGKQVDEGVVSPGKVWSGDGD